MLQDMAEDGYEKIVGGDLSRVVIEQMKIKCANYPQIKFFQVYSEHLQYSRHSYINLRFSAGYNDRYGLTRKFR
jgi:hypothetical protein